MKKRNLDDYIQKQCGSALEYLENHYLLNIYGKKNWHPEKGWDEKKLEEHRKSNDPATRAELLHQYISHHRRKLVELSPDKEGVQAGVLGAEDDPEKEPPYCPNYVMTGDQVRTFLNQEGGNLKY